MNDALNEEIYIEPSTRTWIDWTPDRIKIAERQADAGNFRMAAELCDEILTDDRVQGVLPVRARGLFSLPFTFQQGTGPARTRRKAVRHLEAEDDWWTIAPPADLGEVNSWGILFGCCPVQKVWQQLGERLVPTIDPWHPRNLRRVDGQWRIVTRDGEVPLEIGPRWSLYTPHGAKRPTNGAWRALARWRLLKLYAISDWGVQGERSGGIRVAAPPAPVTGDVSDPSKREAHRKQLAEDLRRMGRNGSLVLPSGWTLSVVQAAANTWQTFKEQIDVANAGIAIALAGQNLTSEVKGGSYAAAEVHKSIANVLLSSDEEALSAWLHDQVLGEWAEYNLGSRTAAPWPDWETQPPQDQRAVADTMTATAAAVKSWDELLGPTGREVDIEEMARRANVPMRALGDAKKDPNT